MNAQAAETLVKNIFTSLDETQSQQLAQLARSFQPAGCRVVINGNPFAEPGLFLDAWQRGVVQTQHSVTAVDYHVIPGTGSAVCSVNGKVRFDESGRDKAGNDATVPAAPGSAGVGGPAAGAAPAARHRPLWGTHFGVSLQLVVDERALSGDFTAAICSFNYNMVFKPDDTLMAL